MSVRSKCQLPGWQMAEISFTEIPLRKADTRKSKRSVGTNKNTAVSYKLDALIDYLKLLTKSNKKKKEKYRNYQQYYYQRDCIFR